MKRESTQTPVQVFAHHSECFRWRTLIQVGDDWTVRGTVWMKNPGSSKPLPEPVSMFDIEALNAIDSSAPWHPFSIDPTMRAIVNLFRERASAKGKPFTGIIQIFNLINVMSPDVREALKLYQSTNNPLKTTTQADIANIVPPVYIGWGDFHQNPLISDIAAEVVSNLKIAENQAEDEFIHPLYLMVYGANNSRCKDIRQRFCAL